MLKILAIVLVDFCKLCNNISNRFVFFNILLWVILEMDLVDFLKHRNSIYMSIKFGRFFNILLLEILAIDLVDFLKHIEMVFMSNRFRRFFYNT